MARDERKDPPSADDCVRIDGEIYDVARWAPNHPGGNLLKYFMGRDASAVFAAFHGPLARRALKGLRARNPPALAPDPASSGDVERDFEALRARAQAEGMFTADRAWFYRRGALVVALAAASIATIALAPALWPLAALALALAWQQGGWLAHDIVHHAVFPTRRAGDLVGVALGGLLLGFSADWWRHKHNTHHALPNVLGADTDIDTMPLLSFDERDLDGASPLARTMVRAQLVTALPIVAFARINWVAQSALWALRAPRVRMRGHELAALALHHAGTVAALALLPSWGARVGFYLLAQLASGVMIGTVFLVGHNARPMLRRDEAPGFYELQCAASQNVRAPRGTAWFFGGLEKQVEHHLFPIMPRHNLGRMSDAVRALCERHGVTYTERGFFEGLGDVIAVLARVARAAGASRSAPPPDGDSSDDDAPPFADGEPT